MERIGDVICVEIKPKCGFIPDAKTIHPSHKVKKTASRFALQQRLKLQQVKLYTCGVDRTLILQGITREISQYSPIDLFSQDSERIQRAVLKLMKTPQVLP